MVESEVNVMIENNSAELKPENNKTDKVDANQLKKRLAEESSESVDTDRSAKKLRLETDGENGNKNENSTKDGVELNDEKNSKAEEKMDCDTNVAEKSQVESEPPVEKEENLKDKDKALKPDKNTEIVGGLEMSVECASDKEASDSEDDKKNDEKTPRPKTIIVKEKPLDGEVEMSGDEESVAENNTQKKKPSLLSSSSSSSLSEENVNTDEKKDKTEKKDNKKESVLSEDKKESSKSEEKTVEAEKKVEESDPVKDEEQSTSEKSNKEDNELKDLESDDKKKMDVDGDDETPLESRKKSPKGAAMKKTNSRKSVGEKKPRGRGKKIEKSAESDHLNSEDETNRSARDSDDKDKSQKESDDSPEIKTLKNFIILAGITIESYDELYKEKECKNDAEKVEKLKELLEKNGVKGRPTADKCKAAKSKRECSEPAPSINVSTGRVLRSRNAPKKTSPRPSTPDSLQSAGDNHKVAASSVVDSDTE